MKKNYLLFILFILSIRLSYGQNTDLDLQRKIREKEAATLQHIQDGNNRSPIFPNSPLSPNSPEQDCNGAIAVCQFSYSQANSYSGNGSVQEIPNNTCLGSNELNSVWYVFTAQTSGNLNFQIVPNTSGNDYDFALYNITGQNCSGIASGAITAVRCNFSATGGSTGLSASGTNASEPASGPNQSSTLAVVAGQTFVLIVSNYSSNQVGYTLNFSNAAGSANIFDVTPPTPTSVYAPCGASTIQLTTSEPVTCASISAAGTEFTLMGTGGPYTVTAASGVNCGTASQQVNITISPALSGAGPWNLAINNGTDNNTLIDNCGNAMLPANLNFITSPTVATIIGPNQICRGATVGLSASNGSAWSWTGSGGFTASTQGISVTPINTSTYTVVVSNGTCPSATATYTITVKPSPTANFNIVPNPVCVGQPVIFTNTSTMAQGCLLFGIPSGNPCPCNFPANCGTPANTGIFVNYLWNFGNGSTAFYLLGNPAANFSPTRTFNTPGTYNIVLTVTDNFSGCSNSLTQQLVVLPSAGPLSVSANTTICPGQSSNLTASGGTNYTWTSNPAGFTANTASVTVSPLVSTTYTVSSPGCSGALTQTVSVTISGSAINTSAIAGTTPIICPNATNVTYSVTNTVGSTYNWTVPAGASIVSGQGTNSITVDFGANAGIVTVTETNSCGSGNPINFVVALGPVPVTSAIVGTSPLCPNALGVTFSVTSTSGSIYNWAVPAGASIASGQGTNSITVNFGTNGGNVSLTETNACGNGTQQNFAVALNTIPITSVITGAASVCPNAAGIIYFVTNNVGSTYNWTVPAGASITAGQGTNSITVTFGNTSGNVSVTETSACATNNANIAVAISATPITSAITGTSTLCAGVTGVAFSVNNTIGSTYNWTVPSGANITSGQTTNAITVTFGATSGTVSVTETNACGVGNPVTFNVVVNPLPVTSAITGTTPICANATGQIYSVINTTGSTYNWTVPASASIVSGQNTNSITVDFATSGGTISVTETSTCGNATPVTFTVVVNQQPITPVIVGTTPLCPNATAITYSVINTAGTTYTWVVPAGANITSGQGSNSILVDFGNAGGNVTVTASNTCGAGLQETFAVAVANNLVVAINPSSPTICSGNSVMLAASGATSYSWVATSTLNTTIGASVSASPTTTTTYTVIGTSAGCSASAMVTVNVNPLVNLTISASQNTLCAGGQSTLTAGGAANYTWSPVATLSSTSGAIVIATPLSTTTYTVSDISANCSSSATITITVIPLANAVAQQDATICIGQSAVLSATGGDTYGWLPVSGLSNSTIASPIAQPLATTTYTVLVSNGGNCASTATLTITVIPLPTANAGIDQTINYGETAILNPSGNGTFIWSEDGNTLSCSVCANPFASPLDNTPYYLTVFSSQGCSSMDTVWVFVNSEFGLYIPNSFSPNGIHNPSFFPKGYGLLEIQLTIFNRWGEKIFESNETNKGWDGTMNGSAVQEDVYVYTVTAIPLKGDSIKRIGQVTLIR